MMRIPKIREGFFDEMKRAREIDPEAFEPLMIPTFTGQQVARQDNALRQARKELEATDGQAQA